MIKYVLIDIDDTLIDFQLSAEASVRSMFREQNFPCPEDIMVIYHKVCDPLWHKVETKEITLKELQGLRWHRIFNELGFDYNPEIDYEQRFREYLVQNAFAVEGSLELLKHLSKKYTVCAASNSFYAQQVKRLALCGFDKFINQVFTSNEIGAEKPSAEFYSACLEKLGSPSKNEVIMIGDSLTADVGGADNFGIKSIWFNKYNRAAENVPADYTVLSLNEIMEIL